MDGNQFDTTNIDQIQKLKEQKLQNEIKNNNKIQPDNDQFQKQQKMQNQEQYNQQNMQQENKSQSQKQQKQSIEQHTQQGAQNTSQIQQNQQQKQQQDYVLPEKKSQHGVFPSDYDMENFQKDENENNSCNTSKVNMISENTNLIVKKQNLNKQGFMSENQFKKQNNLQNQQNDIQYKQKSFQYNKQEVESIIENKIIQEKRRSSSLKIRSQKSINSIKQKLDISSSKQQQKNQNQDQNMQQSGSVESSSFNSNLQNQKLQNKNQLIFENSQFQNDKEHLQKQIITFRSKQNSILDKNQSININNKQFQSEIDNSFQDFDNNHYIPGKQPFNSEINSQNNKIQEQNGFKSFQQNGDKIQQQNSFKRQNSERKINKDKLHFIIQNNQNTKNIEKQNQITISNSQKSGVNQNVDIKDWDNKNISKNQELQNNTATKNNNNDKDSYLKLQEYSNDHIKINQQSISNHEQSQNQQKSEINSSKLQKESLINNLQSSSNNQNLNISSFQQSNSKKNLQVGSQILDFKRKNSQKQFLSRQDSLNKNSKIQEQFEQQFEQNDQQLNQINTDNNNDKSKDNLNNSFNQNKSENNNNISVGEPVFPKVNLDEIYESDNSELILLYQKYIKDKGENFEQNQEFLKMFDNIINYQDFNELLQNNQVTDNMMIFFLSFLKYIDSLKQDCSLCMYFQICSENNGNISQINIENTKKIYLQDSNDFDINEHLNLVQILKNQNNEWVVMLTNIYQQNGYFQDFKFRQNINEKNIYPQMLKQILLQNNVFSEKICDNINQKTEEKEVLLQIKQKIPQNQYQQFCSETSDSGLFVLWTLFNYIKGVPLEKIEVKQDQVQNIYNCFITFILFHKFEDEFISIFSNNPLQQKSSQQVENYQINQSQEQSQFIQQQQQQLQVIEQSLTDQYEELPSQNQNNNIQNNNNDDQNNYFKQQDNEDNQFQQQNQYRILETQDFNIQAFESQQEKLNNVKKINTFSQTDEQLLYNLLHQLEPPVQIYKDCKKCQNSDKLIKELQKELKRLEYMLQYKELAIQKRTEMMSVYSKENSNIKQKIKQQENMIEKQKEILIKYQNENSEMESHVISQQKEIRSIQSSQKKKRMVRASTAQGLSRPNQMMLQNQNNQRQTANYFRNTISIEKLPQIQNMGDEIQQQKKQNKILISEQLQQYQQQQQQQQQQQLNQNNSLSTGQNFLRQLSNQSYQQRDSYQKNQNNSQSPTSIINKTGASSPLKIRKVEQRQLPDKIDQYVMMKEDELKKWKINNRLLWIKDYCMISEQFFDKLQIDNKRQRQEFAKELGYFTNEFQYAVDMALVYRYAYQIQSISLNNFKLIDAYDKILSELRSFIKSDRIYLYIYDDQVFELWCYNNEKIIRVKPTGGILKSAFNYKKFIKVTDITFDTRYDKQFDSPYYDQSRNVIWSPIIDYQGELRGMIQILNFQEIQKATSVDEQSSLQILGKCIGNFLYYSTTFQDAIINQQRTNNLLETSVSVQKTAKTPDVIIESQNCLQKVMNSNKCLIYLYKKDTHQLIKYTKYKNGQIEQTEYSANAGIFGECIRQEDIIITADHKNHACYNSMVDVDTSLGSYTQIIKADGKVLGVIQVATQSTLGTKKNLKQNMFLNGILQFFSNLISNCLQRIQSIENVLQQSLSTMFGGGGLAGGGGALLGSHSNKQNSGQKKNMNQLLTLQKGDSVCFEESEEAEKDSKEMSQSEQYEQEVLQQTKTKQDTKQIQNDSNDSEIKPKPKMMSAFFTKKKQ